MKIQREVSYVIVTMDTAKLKDSAKVELLVYDEDISTLSSSVTQSADCVIDDERVSSV